MTRTVQVKICGIRDVSNLEVAINSGADYIGLVFYPPSPRAVTIKQAAELSEYIKSQDVSKKIELVGLFVDPEDALLEEVLGQVSLDIIQLHGSETPECVDVIRKVYNLPVIKALAVSDKSDINIARSYEPVADWLLFDTKPPAGELPGGTGKSFDWSLLAGQSFSKPWMLSGGLTPENVQEALRVLKPDAVDVSSGVESSRGVKDPARIRGFIKAAKGFNS